MHNRQPSSTSPSRRRFLKGTGAALAGAPFFTPGLSIASPAGSKLNHAVVGVGGLQGMNDLMAFTSHPKLQVAVLCDVDTRFLAEAKAKFPSARTYGDWREMLEKEGDRIDSVSITIPDHMHAPVAFSALRRGKHVYCQKPLTHTIDEARKIRTAAEKAGTVTQMGNQIQSAIEYRSAVEMIQAGVIGKIKEVHAWSSAVYTGTGRPKKGDPVPEQLNWENWIGVAPERPFAKDVYHHLQWRCWQDFGGGAMGDFGCHILDSPFRALELSQPTSIQNHAVDPAWHDNPAARRENWPAWERVEFTFPGTRFTTDQTIVVTWYDGGKKPATDLFPFSDDEKQFVPDSGALFIGEGGAMTLPHVGGPRLVPRELNRGIKRPKLKPRDHYHHFIDACLGDAKTTSHFGYAANLTETTLLGCIACRFPNENLQWDPARLQFTNASEANQFVRKSYRDGWHIEGLG